MWGGKRGVKDPHDDAQAMQKARPLLRAFTSPRLPLHLNFSMRVAPLLKEEGRVRLSDILFLLGGAKKTCIDLSIASLFYLLKNRHLE